MAQQVVNYLLPEDQEAREYDRENLENYLGTISLINRLDQSASGLQVSPAANEQQSKSTSEAILSTLV